MSTLADHTPIDKLNELLASGTYDQIRILIGILKPVDIAALLESSPPRERTVIWNLLVQEQRADVLQELDEELVGDLLAHIPTDDVVHMLEQVDSDDDLTDILQHLPDAITHQLLRSMDSQDRDRVENLLSYPEDTACGLMEDRKSTRLNSSH